MALLRKTKGLNSDGILLEKILISLRHSKNTLLRPLEKNLPCTTLKKKLNIKVMWLGWVGLGCVVVCCVVLLCVRVWLVGWLRGCWLLVAGCVAVGCVVSPNPGHPCPGHPCPGPSKISSFFMCVVKTFSIMKTHRDHRKQEEGRERKKKNAKFWPPPGPPSHPDRLHLFLGRHQTNPPWRNGGGRASWTQKFFFECHTRKGFFKWNKVLFSRWVPKSLGLP